MDLNDVRIVVTLVSLALFVALFVHTWSRRRSGEHAAAAQLPFQEEDAQRAEPAGEGERGE
ncbi:MAG: cbb3-type cytochrome c oxidase subunit 3 [Burkholderiales bacterium]|nr:cbb3-type cytochrome c oxidase subunit 3 [Burkholderiales bacterium]